MGGPIFLFLLLTDAICKCKKFMLTRGSFLNYYNHYCYYFYYFCIGLRSLGPLSGAVSFGPLTGSVDFLGCAVRCCQSHWTESSTRVFGWWSTSSWRREPSFAGNLGVLLGSNGSFLNALRSIAIPVFAWTAFQYSISSLSDMRLCFQYSISSLSIVSSSSELTDILLSRCWLPSLLNSF